MILDDDFESRVEAELLRRSDTVTLPKEVAQRMISFINKCAMEGIFFESTGPDMSDYYLDSELIMYEMTDHSWWPKEILEEWSE